MRSSVAAPRFTCTENPSAPCARAASTDATITFSFALSPRSVDAEACTSNPVRLPRSSGATRRTRPLCTITPDAPPAQTLRAAAAGSSSPAKGPTLTPWSIGTKR